MRAASRPTLQLDPENDELADDVIDLAAALLTVITDTDEATERHRERTGRTVRKNRRARGWGDDQPEAPLYKVWETAMEKMAESARMHYEDWRHELAHLPVRRVN